MAFLKKTPGRKLQSTDREGSGAISCPALPTIKPPAADPAAKGLPPETPAAEDLLTATALPSMVLPDKKWLHMDILEKDKLEWTTDVPPARFQPDMDRVDSRFSLDGVVLSRSEEVPFHLGLHHHGDEPEVR